MSVREIHSLLPVADGTAHQLCAERFGAPVARRKVYVQAGLHADEVPAMLVAVCLKERLQALEAADRLRCEVVLLTAANPVGLAQFVLGTPVGRFDLASGRNFNRGFPVLGERIAEAVEARLTDDIDHNRTVIREAWMALLDAMTPRQTFDDLQRRLMQLSVDADIVLDLHCSREAAMHVYTGAAIWDEVEPLARYLGAQASLLAVDSGGQSFDEAHSLTWWQLQQRFGERFPIPRGAISVTVEHRGQRDVSDALAGRDADAIVAYLSLAGMIDAPVEPPPPLPFPATPLAGSEQFYAPVSGILLHRVPEGTRVEAGTEMFEIVDPVEGTRTRLHSRTAGMFYMRRDVRYVRAGDPLGRVTGERSVRTGYLLGA
ncbi:succinylglutamate desuccinylase/aspartoacylase family protein [Burkholderia plantarii]|uniref:Succinylglutamate desuccinylase/aspartoacylase n=1 Tax=Burkholderia plantarii TaxID=41899 RepID=A0A0B6RRI1_BURPL|nr:succinylglutamate desuccinylase/aspartoacylase family protein [Burkholderia plantarii]AJK45988.1 succinylglutamate desuccinylase/aspartoacylase [Burkholderia plantarii]